MGSSILGPMTFGHRLRAARKAAGLTQRALGDACKVRELAVVQWEAGRAVPRSDRVVLAAIACGVSTDWLLSGEGVGPAAEVA